MLSVQYIEPEFIGIQIQIQIIGAPARFRSLMMKIQLHCADFILCFFLSCNKDTKKCGVVYHCLQNIELTIEVETLRKEKQEDEERFHQLSSDLTAMRQTGQQEIDSLSDENDRLRKQFDVQVEENRKVGA
jgi:hypothetical protein